MKPAGESGAEYRKEQTEMNRYAQLKERLRERRTVSVSNVMLALSPFVVDALSESDFILLDKEHGLYGTEELVPLTMRCREKGVPSIVRVEDSVYHLIAKAIDLGADGVMLPRTETVEQVRVAVDAIHFAPIGRTGFGGWGIMRPGETFEEFQRGRFFFPQIESPRGLENLPAMLDACGEYIDGVIIGPNDYSVQLGIPRQLDHPMMLENIRKVFDVCRAYGKSCGCFAADGEHVKLYAGMGANIFWVGDDSTYVRLGLRQLLDAIP